MTDCPTPDLAALSAPPPWVADLRALYAELDAQVERLGPTCQLSGRCCRFQEYGHTLFVSTPEVEYLITAAPNPVRPLDLGQTCPWQDHRGRCTAREARPLGCRVYFCDASYGEHGRDLSEQFIARLKRLTENHRLPWNYAPLHHHLAGERCRGVFLFDDAHDDLGRAHHRPSRQGKEDRSNLNV
jgi:Fe-S-cluster containining protein